MNQLQTSAPTNRKVALSVACCVVAVIALQLTWHVRDGQLSSFDTALHIDASLQYADSIRSMWETGRFEPSQLLKPDNLIHRPGLYALTTPAWLLLPRNIHTPLVVSFLLFLCTLLLLGLLARRLIGTSRALFAIGMYATTPACIGLFRYYLPEQLLCIYVLLWTGYLLFAEARISTTARWATLIAFVLLGGLIKTSYILYAAPLYLVMSGRPRREILLAICCMAALTAIALWASLSSFPHVLEGTALMQARQSIVGHHIFSVWREVFSQGPTPYSVFPAWYFIAFYPLMLAKLTLLPVLLCLSIALFYAWLHRKDEDNNEKQTYRSLFIGTAVCMLVFTLIGQKRGDYLQPLIPLVCILAATIAPSKQWTTRALLGVILCNLLISTGLSFSSQPIWKRLSLSHGGDAFFLGVYPELPLADSKDATLAGLPLHGLRVGIINCSNAFPYPNAYALQIRLNYPKTTVHFVDLPQQTSHLPKYDAFVLLAHLPMSASAEAIASACFPCNASVDCPPIRAIGNFNASIPNAQRRVVVMTAKLNPADYPWISDPTAAATRVMRAANLSDIVGTHVEQGDFSAAFASIARSCSRESLGMSESSTCREAKIFLAGKLHEHLVSVSEASTTLRPLQEAYSTLLLELEQFSTSSLTIARNRLAYMRAVADIYSLPDSKQPHLCTPIIGKAVQTACIDGLDKTTADWLASACYAHSAGALRQWITNAMTCAAKSPEAATQMLRNTFHPDTLLNLAMLAASSSNTAEQRRLGILLTNRTLQQFPADTNRFGIKIELVHSLPVTIDCRATDSFLHHLSYNRPDLRAAFKLFAKRCATASP